MRRLAALLLVSGLFSSAMATDWPQWLGTQRDGVWRESGLLKTFPKDGLKVLWRAPVGAGYAGPAVANERVYIMDRKRATNPDGTPTKGEPGKGQPGTETLFCLDSKTGKELWKHTYSSNYAMSYGSGPRTTPIVEGKFVYMLGGMGHLKCLTADTGSIVWEKELPKEYSLSNDIGAMLKQPDKTPATTPVWGYSAHLLIDGDVLYTLAGGKDSAVVALDKKTGKEIWKALNAVEVCYAPPMIYTIGGTRQLIIWLDETINSLDPKTGKLYWSVPYPTGKLQRPAVAIHTPRLIDDKLFFSTFYHGSTLLQVTGGDKPAAKVVWAGKSENPTKPDGLHMMMAPPILKDGHVYGVCAMGQLRCLSLSDGKEVWNTLKPVYTGEQFAKAEARMKRAMENDKPPEKKEEGKTEAAKEEAPARQAKMPGVDCGNIFLIPLGDKSDRYLLCTDQGEAILAELSPKGYKELDRTKLIEPDHAARNRNVVWSHPAFANKCIFARNDKEIICVSFSE